MAVYSKPFQKKSSLNNLQSNEENHVKTPNSYESECETPSVVPVIFPLPAPPPLSVHHPLSVTSD